MRSLVFDQLHHKSDDFWRKPTGQQSADSRPTACRSIVGELSADNSTNRRPTINSLLTDYQPSVSSQLADMSTDCRLTYWLTVDWQGASVHMRPKHEATLCKFDLFCSYIDIFFCRTMHSNSGGQKWTGILYSSQPLSRSSETRSEQSISRNVVLHIWPAIIARTNCMSDILPASFTRTKKNNIHADLLVTDHRWDVRLQWKHGKVTTNGDACQRLSRRALTPAAFELIPLTASDMPAPRVDVEFRDEFAIFRMKNGENRFNLLSLAAINEALDEVERWVCTIKFFTKIKSEPTISVQRTYSTCMGLVRARVHSYSSMES